MPPPEPVSTAAPAPARAPTPAPSNPNGQEEFSAPGPGWQFTGANRAVNRPNWGTYPLQNPLTMVGEPRHHQLLNTAPTIIRIRVSNPVIEIKARTLEEGTTIRLRERVMNISPSPLAKEDATLAMIMHAMCDKSLGIMMVSPLLKLGLNNHIFVFMCVLFRLELSEHYSYP